MVDIVDTWSTWVHRLSCLYNCYTFLVPFVAICFVFYEVDAFSDFLPISIEDAGDEDNAHVAMRYVT